MPSPCCLINLISPAYSISSHPWDMLMVMSLESMEGKITEVQNKLTAELPGFFHSFGRLVLSIVFLFLFECSMVKSMIFLFF